MSIDQRLEKLSILMKLRFVFNWMFDPAGINPVATIKILHFKILFLFKIIQYLLKGLPMNKSVLKARDEFMIDTITTIAKSKDGFLFHITKGVDLDVIQSFREKFVNEKFIPKEGDIVIDAGANIGFYTIRASATVKNTGKVIAIEADPITYDKLTKNIKINNLKNIIPVNVAAFSEKKVVKLYRTSMASTNSLKNTGTSEFVEVEATTIDEICMNLGLKRVDWMKIDVEGVEVEVLIGAENIISHNPQLKILIEVHSENDILKIKNILDRNKFSIIYDNKNDLSSHHIYAEKVTS